jgi:hypothetical protein
VSAHQRTRESREKQEAGGRELDDPEAVIEPEVGVQPPPEPPIEFLHAVDIRNGDDDHFELHIDFRDAGVAPCALAGYFVGARGCVLRCGVHFQLLICVMLIPLHLCL